MGRGFSPRKRLITAFVPNVREKRAPLKPLTAFIAKVDLLGKVKGGGEGGEGEGNEGKREKIK